MGYYVGSDYKKFYIENGVVYDGPGGRVLHLDPNTLKPLVKQSGEEKLKLVEEPTVPLPIVEKAPEPEPEPENVLTDYTDEVKVEKFIKHGKHIKPLVHLKKCTSQGRGGKYTEDCPKCDWLKKGK